MFEFPGGGGGAGGGEADLAVGTNATFHLKALTSNAQQRYSASYSRYQCSTFNFRSALKDEAIPVLPEFMALDPGGRGPHHHLRQR